MSRPPSDSRDFILRQAEKIEKALMFLWGGVLEGDMVEFIQTLFQQGGKITSWALDHSGDSAEWYAGPTVGADGIEPVLLLPAILAMPCH